MNEKNHFIKKKMLNGKIMTEFDALRRKTYSYLRNDDDENKKSKRQKTVCRTNNLN